jgi:hypothetical protein
LLTQGGPLKKTNVLTYFVYTTLHNQSDQGKVVLCDRFVSSTLAYQLDGDGLTAAEIREIETKWGAMIEGKKSAGPKSNRKGRRG